jgi:hypothetical protein
MDKADKKTAIRLVSFWFQKVNKSTHPLDSTFYFYEYIAKGYAMLEVCKRDDFNDNQKNELYKIIREL